MDKETEAMVHRALSNAMDNGYGDLIYKVSPHALACDLRGCDADLETMSLSDIYAGMTSWFVKYPRQLKVGL